MTENAPAFGVPPSLRELLCGTAPYGGNAHQDVHATLGYSFPNLIVDDLRALHEDAGGSWAVVELLRGLYISAARMLTKRDGLTRLDHRIFQTRLLVAWTELGRLLDGRAAEDIELDWNYGTSSPLDDLRDRMTILMAMLGEQTALRMLPAILWRYARRAKPDEGMLELYCTAFGAEIEEGSHDPRTLPNTRLLDVLGHWRVSGEACMAEVALLARGRIRDAVGEAMLAQREAVAPAPKPMSRLGGIRKEASEQAPTTAQPGAVVVFPALSRAATGKGDNGKEIRQCLGGALDVPLSGVPVPSDWDDWERRLVARWPHMLDVPRAIREAQAGRTHWGSMRLCLVGPAGVGKTAIGRAVAQESGMPFARYNADNASDNSFGGTSIRWGSGHLGVVPAMLADAMRSTGLVQIDEIEKAAGHRQSTGGRLHDVLHGMWDAETSSRWLCPFTAMPLDLSHVAYLATANDLDGIPASLRDRMRVVEIRAPGPEHLSVLVPQVAAEACREQGLDAAWGVLDGDEWEALRGAWGAGGSIRRLQHLVAALLRARDADPSVARH